MYKCFDCGRIFEDADVRKEIIGEFWGMPATQEESVCPFCGGDYEETVQCCVCGTEHLKEELNDCVCDNCIDKYKKDFNACYNLTLGETEEIKINVLLASLFEPSDIEAILKEYICDRWQDVNCSQFIDNNIDWIAEKIEEEVKKNENSKK